MHESNMSMPPPIGNDREMLPDVLSHDLSRQSALAPQTAPERASPQQNISQEREPDHSIGLSIGM